MPFFTIELNRIADDVGMLTSPFACHLVLPTNLAPASGRTTAGGGVYATGQPLPPLTFPLPLMEKSGTPSRFPSVVAIGDVGTVIGWSAFRGAAPVAYTALPATTINSGDSFEIDANSLQINGSTT